MSNPKWCDFNINNLKTALGRPIRTINCDEGYAKFKVTVIDQNDKVIETRNVCRFCLDRYTSLALQDRCRIEVEGIN